LVKNRINNVVDTMHNIHSATTSDDEFIFAILPIAYAMMEMDVLMEEINNLQKDGAISAKLRRDLQYVLGEIG
jgi:hypothetical protein